MRAKEPDGMSQNEYLRKFIDAWGSTNGAGIFDNFIIFSNYWIIELR